ncbi:hypothetical protein O982_24420 [Mycobacterium avium 10-5581]|nr:hypothetical protein O982_24420 [Mycobacterium avium 10-5581]
MDVDDASPIGGSDITDVGTYQFVRAQSGEHSCQDDRPVTFGPIRTAR